MDTLSEDEGDTDCDTHMKDGPFSALTPSMWPQDYNSDFSPVSKHLHLVT